MNKKTIILLTTGLLTIVGGILIFNSIKPQKEQILTDSELVTEVMGNIKEQSLYESKKFNTAEEMYEYSESLDKLLKDEGKIFIEDFYKSLPEFSIEDILARYEPSIRQSALENGFVPILDPTNSLIFNIENLKVEEGKKSFTVTYSLKISNQDTELETLERVDNIQLIKENGRIFISNYSRK